MPWAWPRPRTRGSCWPARRRSTAIPRSTPSARITGATSTRSAPAAATTRPSDSPRRSPWPITAITASRRGSSASSTPMARGCGSTTAACCPISWGRPSAASRSPSTASGEQTRSFCYVSDLVEGIYRLLHADFSEPVNLGNPGRDHSASARRGDHRPGRGNEEHDHLRGPSPGRSPSGASPTSPAPVSCWAGSRWSIAPRA